MEKHEAETMVYTILEQSRQAKEQSLRALEVCPEDVSEALENLKQAEELLFSLLPLEQALLFEQRNKQGADSFFLLYALQILDNSRLCYEMVKRICPKNPDSED